MKHNYNEKKNFTDEDWLQTNLFLTQNTHLLTSTD